MNSAMSASSGIRVFVWTWALNTPSRETLLGSRSASIWTLEWSQSTTSEPLKIDSKDKAQDYALSINLGERPDIKIQDSAKA